MSLLERGCLWHPKTRIPSPQGKFSETSGRREGPSQLMCLFVCVLGHDFIDYEALSAATLESVVPNYYHQ